MDFEYAIGQNTKTIMSVACLPYTIMIINGMRW